MKPRPTKKAPEIIRKAAEALATEVKEWLGPDDETEIEEIIKDLEKALKWHRDGYEIAKRMDDYMPDAALVDILDRAGWLVDKAHNEACVLWLQEAKLKEPEIGALVRHTKMPERGIGTVVRNSPEGTSTVSFPTMGHVTEGLGTIGFILPWEELEAV